MPILLLTHYIKYGLLEANYFLTGPTIVDKSNIERRQQSSPARSHGAALHAADGLADAPGRCAAGIRRPYAIRRPKAKDERMHRSMHAEAMQKVSRGPGGLAAPTFDVLAPANRRQEPDRLATRSRRVAHRGG